jgi:hypothetical protein
MSYTQAYPALAPLVSTAPEDGVPDIRAGDRLSYDHVTRAKSQYRVRKCLLETDRALPIEVQQAAYRCDQLKSELGLTVAAPWVLVMNYLQTFRQDMQTFQDNTELTLQAIRTDMQTFQDDTELTLQAIRTDIHSLQVSQRYQDAIRCNRIVNAQNPAAVIAVVPHRETGDFPGDGVWFPATAGMLTAASDDDINQLHAFYELPVNNDRFGKVVSLFWYLGIPNFIPN